MKRLLLIPLFCFSLAIAARAAENSANVPTHRLLNLRCTMSPDPSAGAGDAQALLAESYRTKPEPLVIDYDLNLGKLTVSNGITTQQLNVSETYFSFDDSFPLQKMEILIDRVSGKIKLVANGDDYKKREEYVGRCTPRVNAF